MSYYEQREEMARVNQYFASTAFWFTKNTDPAGVLSNMHPLGVEAGGRRWKTTEALYQASRFPDHPAVQEVIWAQGSPMGAKMKSLPHRDGKGREDWDEVKVSIMEWCLRLKLAFNFRFIYWALRDSAALPIVEICAKEKPRGTDLYWGTGRDEKSSDSVAGCNVLGKLWMAVREELLADPSAQFRELGERYSRVPPPPVPNLKLFGEEVREIQVSLPPQRAVA